MLEHRLHSKNAGKTYFKFPQDHLTINKMVFAFINICIMNIDYFRENKRQENGDTDFKMMTVSSNDNTFAKIEKFIEESVWELESHFQDRNTIKIKMSNFMCKFFSQYLITKSYFGNPISSNRANFGGGDITEYNDIKVLNVHDIVGEIVVYIPEQIGWRPHVRLAKDFNEEFKFSDHVKDKK